MPLPINIEDLLNKHKVESNRIEFKNVKWNISQMIKDGIIDKGHLSAEPEGVSMATLMKYVIHNQK